MIKKIYYIFLGIGVFYLLLPKSGTAFYELNIRWFYVFLLSFLLCQLLTPVCIWFGNKFDILDYPSSRKIHIKPIPRTGGLAIFLAFFFALFRNLHFEKAILGIFIAGFIIVVLGLVDDKLELSATVKLFGQIVISIILVITGATITFLPEGFPFEHFLEGVITVIWVIGITNAINCLDGMDGLATSFSIISALCFFGIFLSQHNGQSPIGYITIAIIGSSLGFLSYNFKFWSNEKATIFLGDSGSTFLGFILASIAVLGTWAEENAVVAISTPLLILGIPIFDMIYITISRFVNKQVKNIKEWLEYVGKDHFHHRLNNIGLTEKHSVFFILALNTILCFSALIIRQTGTVGSLILLSQSTLIFLIIVVLMRLGRERY